MTVEFTYRPIQQWPADSRILHQRSRFGAGYGTTLELLDRELGHLGAKNVVVEVALTESDIRLDGRPRARAVAAHPGVILAFDSKYGPLKYAAGVFSTWQDNIRAIALGLEALRKVDRYGITKRGEQYTGWKALTAGEATTRTAARELLDSYGGEKAELRATHPDIGGDSAEFDRVQEARKILTAGSPSVAPAAAVEEGVHAR